MLAPANSLLRAGIGLKLSQIKLATRSYLRDRTNQATGTMTSYAIAAALFAAAGIFLIAACFVGTVALYRWIAIHYGQFWGFGAIGALLVTIAAICAGVAAARLKQPPPHFPTLTSRLRVAIKANPLERHQIEAARDTAASVLLAPSAPPSQARARRSRPARNNRNVQAGLIVMATLLGWAATRRRSHARQTGI
jgi:Putative Actinobacterial Holin-X, holin superfamily III